jgi:hypothetical protein
VWFSNDWKRHMSEGLGIVGSILRRRVVVVGARVSVSAYMSRSSVYDTIEEQAGCV